MPIRRPDSDAAAKIGGSPVMIGVEQGDVADGAAHRPDRVAGVADRHHAGAVVAPLGAAVADRGTQADDAAERGRNAGRAAGVGAEAGRDDARGDRRRGAAGGAAGMRVRSYGFFTGPAKLLRLVLVMPKASSCRFALAMTIAPASTSFCSVGAFAVGRTPRSAGGAAGGRQVAAC